jgi:hypothetical protein
MAVTLNAWEMLLLEIIQAAAPTVENLFIHSARGVAIFNASDNLLNGVIGALTQPTPPVTPPAA